MWPARFGRVIAQLASSNELHCMCFFELKYALNLGSKRCISSRIGALISANFTISSSRFLYRSVRRLFERSRKFLYKTFDIVDSQRTTQVNFKKILLFQLQFNLDPSLRAIRNEKQNCHYQSLVNKKFLVSFLLF